MTREVLERKLTIEFETLTRSPCQSFREDIYNFLILSEWSDDAMSRLTRIPNLLQEVELALRDDDSFGDCFEQRAKALTLELAEHVEDHETPSGL